MAVKLKDTTATAILNGSSIATLFPTTAHLKIYAGTQPTDANTAISGQTLLADITISGGWGTPASRAVAKAGTWDDSSADGGSATAPTFVRLSNSADTERIDMDAGVGSGTVTFTGAITAGQDVPISTFSIAF